jgi:aspartyl-tRNA(Asn)/glutamyl-tRNA(Gln) amidotransferase subunit A
MSDTSHIGELTAVQMLELYDSGGLSPVEVAQASLDQIEALDEKVNAWCYLDPETTLTAARRSEERWRNGQPMGLLDGVPVAIKDMFMTRGWPNTKGSHIVDAAQLGEDDGPAVAALRRHGAVPMGRTTTPEFGWKGVTDTPRYGITRNPWDPDKTAGGSSGGSSAAVALGMSALALGTDAGGSVRIPAGFCGHPGLKPTQGRAPIWPASPFGFLAHPGPMAWTVEDCALLMQVMAEQDYRDPTLPADPVDYLAGLGDGVRGLHVAFSPRFGWVDVDPEIAALVAEAVRVFEELGAHVEEVDPGFDDPLESFGRLFYGGAANALRDVDAKQRQRMDPALIEVVEQAEKLSMLDYQAAMNERAALNERMSRFHQRYDLLLTPALPIPAFKAGLEVPEGWPHKRWPTWTPFTYPFNMTGQPAMSVPCGFTRAGLPAGLQIVAARHQDALVLQAGHAYQSARPLTDRRPELCSLADYAQGDRHD